MSAQRKKLRSGCAWHSAYHMYRLVSASAYRDRSLLSHAAAADTSAQPEAQIPRYRERHPPLAEDVWHPLSRIGRGSFPQAVRNAVTCDALTRELMEAMLTTRCWGACLSREVTALAFKTAIDDPHRFRWCALRAHAQTLPIGDHRL